MQTRIAVEAVIGSSPRTRPAIGVTATTGSRAKRMIKSPMVAFQKLITVHGRVTANSASQRGVERAEAADRERHDQEPDQGDDREPDQREKQRLPPAQRHQRRFRRRVVAG